MSLLDFILSIIGGVAAYFLGKQIDRKTGTQKARQFQLDSASLSLLNSALRLLPEEEREKYREDWFMVLCDLDSPSERIKHAADFGRAAVQIAAGLILASGREWVLARWNRLRLIKSGYAQLNPPLPDPELIEQMRRMLDTYREHTKEYRRALAQMSEPNSRYSIAQFQDDIDDLLSVDSSLSPREKEKLREIRRLGPEKWLEIFEATYLEASAVIAEYDKNIDQIGPTPSAT